ncbi:7 transmembrane receptor (rhodopsin family) domain-containing protein [Ditylenchus destructor]|uniref:7 transmembrane receptor (Rhodopsin family) domain-containing protein n=1 Tax=Ditylenchus destructor TaxID=166010 RepID=A0AAD4NDN6_9BILA|nr:7 transmembrane receptor (rhodopsin family) domain-containing protein [Ditylenchus destructor]
MESFAKTTSAALNGFDTSTPIATNLIGNRTESSSNWTEFSCSWLDEVYNIQNDFYWQHISSTEILVLYAFVCSFGGLANLFVIVAFARTSHLRNLRNYFIVNLAFSDLMLCAVTAPVTLYLTLNLFWPFGGLACQMVASVQAVNMFVSCLTLVLIALDRFLLTLCPVKWRLAAKAPVCCYLVVWLTSIIVAAPYFFAVSAEQVTMFDPWNSAQAEHMLSICNWKRPEICIEKAWHRLPFSRRTYTLTVLAIQYVLPLSALIYAYSQIGSTIRKRIKYSTTVDHNRKQLLTKRNRKALLLLLLLVIIYAIAWLPINLYNVLNVLDIIEFSQYRYIFCHLIGMSSACINPILYALINDSFRSAFLAMLRPCFSPCTKYITVSGSSAAVSAGGNADPAQFDKRPQHTHTTFSSTNGGIANDGTDQKIESPLIAHENGYINAAANITPPSVTVEPFLSPVTQQSTGNVMSAFETLIPDSDPKNIHDLNDEKLDLRENIADSLINNQANRLAPQDMKNNKSTNAEELDSPC